MGTWEAGIQQGVGIMIFADGTRRAGFFDQNLFVKSIKQNSDIDPYRAILDPKCVAELEKFVEEYQYKLEEKKLHIRKKSLEAKELSVSPSREGTQKCGASVGHLNRSSREC